jgi:hypothetical protein
MGTADRRSESTSPTTNLRAAQSKTAKPLVRTRVKSIVGKASLLWPSLQILESLPIFAPNSAGAANERALLTIQAANQTFPLMLELLARTGTKIEDPTPIAKFADTSEKQAAALRLKELFDQYGSDKGDTNHRYHLLYGALLASTNASALLEIGLGTNNVNVVSNMGSRGKPGASLRAFRDYLPGAQIYGADVDRGILFNEERISTFFVDQTDLDSFSTLSAAVPAEFDLIIDDGLHSPNANLATLVFGLNRLKVNGYFLVEDIGPDALPIWQLVSAALLPSGYESDVIVTENKLLFLVRRLK